MKEAGKSSSGGATSFVAINISPEPRGYYKSLNEVFLGLLGLN